LTLVHESVPVAVRRARIGDVPQMKTLIDSYAGRVLLERELVTLYEDVQEFQVAELDRRIVGCGALHVLWEDLAEIRSLAVDREVRRRGIGDALVGGLIKTAAELGLPRIFVLTFETDFFSRHGFQTIVGTPVPPEVYDEMRRSPDPGVAEFLDLPYAKPNTLGNTRMLRKL